MRLLLPLLLAVFSLLTGCSLVTDFDQTFPGETEADAAVDAAVEPDSELPTGRCAEDCIAFTSCMSMLAQSGQETCEGFRDEDNRVQFTAYCLADCNDDGGGPPVTRCDGEIVDTAREDDEFSEALDQVCERRAAFCDGVCMGRPLSNLDRCLSEAGGVDRSSCRTRCDWLPQSFHICVGQRLYEARGSDDPDFFCQSAYKPCFEAIAAVQENEGLWPPESREGR